MQLLQKDLDSQNVGHFCEVSDLMSDTDQPTESDDNLELFRDLREDGESGDCSGDWLYVRNRITVISKNSNIIMFYVVLTICYTPL